MKSRFTTIDLRAVIAELGTKLLGLRVLNVYDINNKTYLIRLQGPDQKVVLLFESGTRIHTTSFEWPKGMMPSSFSMKLRKHLRSRRLVEIRQLGIDRVVDLQFGSDEAAYHLIVELYDRGNIALTDHEYTILSLLRTRKDSEDVRFAVREKFPVENARQHQPIPEVDRIQEILSEGKPGDNIRKLLNPHFVYGPALIDHCLLAQSFPSNARGNSGFDIQQDMPRIMTALEEGEHFMEKSGSQCKGYIIQKREKKPTASPSDPDAELLTYSEFHPFLFKQHESQPFVEFDTFDQAVDEFFSKVESQKLDMKALQQEKDALKKLHNVKKDHEKRIDSLQKNQELNEKKGALIEINLTLVEQALRVVRSAVANQIDWSEIDNIIKEAQTQGDPVASAIRGLKLDTNHFSMVLRDPYMEYDDDDDDDDDDGDEGQRSSKPEGRQQPLIVDIDLGLSAYANARKYFVQKKHSKKKEQRTVESSTKAIKSAEKKTKQALKDVATVASINKMRKIYWFEKFFWCISSENYIIIAGRDQQQNEMVVKKYLSQGDIYVHADIHGASSVIIKNPSGGPIPPKTLQEAGTIAICYSVAWEAKVITSAWWVRHDQVSKTAPTGEYLTTGSFMIRGKKNYLPPSQLVMGFGLMFKIDESCAWRHKGERRVRKADDDDLSSLAETVDTDLAIEDIEEEEEDGEDEEEDEAGESKDDEEDDSKEDAEAGEVSDSDAEEDVPGESKDEKEEEEEMGEEDKETSGVDNEKDEMENLYPDTTIQLHHVQGDRYEPQRLRGSSMLSTGSYHSADGDIDEEGKALIYLGDDKPIVVGGPKAQPPKSKPRLSAKQRRDLKKQKKRQELATIQKGGEEEDGDVEPLAADREMKEEEEEGEIEDTGAVKEEKRGEEEDEEEENDTKQGERASVSRSISQSSTSYQPVPPKRGQKHKMKKMKQKYKDQDEEERRIKMEILASAGGPKDVKGKKGKKSQKQEEQLQKMHHNQSARSKHKQQLQQQQQQRGQGKQGNKQTQGQRPTSGKQQDAQGVTGQGSGGGGVDVKSENQSTEEGRLDQGEEVKTEEQPDDSSIKPVVMTHAWEAKKRKGQMEDGNEDSDEDKDAVEENVKLMEESVSVLDTLTGCPHPDDLLLFAIPVCAPYNIMHDYKFKVKLTPGQSKKGKAAKSALNMFQHAKDTTPREKDLFKGVKDVDLSRNIPGKVKVSGPNLHQKKKK